jgi:hypothetical protein
MTCATRPTCAEVHACGACYALEERPIGVIEKACKTCFVFTELYGIVHSTKED